MLGRLLCWWGIHDTQISGWNQPIVPGAVFSTWGYCTRRHKGWVCQFSWQFDNPDWS